MLKKFKNSKLINGFIFKIKIIKIVIPQNAKKNFKKLSNLFLIFLVTYKIFENLYLKYISDIKYKENS